MILMLTVYNGTYEIKWQKKTITNGRKQLGAS